MRLTIAGLLADVRSGLRALRGTPTPAVASVLVVAVALTGLTTTAGLLQALVYRELPVVQEASELVSFSLQGPTAHPTNVSWPVLTALGGQTKTVTGFCGVAVGLLLPVETEGSVALDPATILTPNCFSILGIQPYRGRLLTPADDDPAVGPAHAVVLGYSYWRRRFGGAPVIGRPLAIHGLTYSIVGVAPPGFTGLGVELSSDVMVPVKYDQVGRPDPARPHGVMFAVGRLRAGATRESARAELVGLWPTVREATIPVGQTAAQLRDLRLVHVEVASYATGSSSLRARYAEPLKVLTAIAGVLLLAAAATLSGLLLSQAVSRQQEFATRVALGADRIRLARQVLVEAVAPPLVGACAAIPLSWWLRRAVAAAIWTGLSPVTLDLTPDWRTVGLTVVAAVAAGLVIGLVPALTVAVTPYQLSAPTRSGSRSARRLGGLVFVAQVAASTPLVFCAGLLVLSAWRLTHVDLGFSGEHVLTARLMPLDHGYDGINVSTYYKDLAATLESLPGVRSVAFSKVFPAPVTLPETVAPRETTAAGSTETPVALEIVSPTFFDTAGVALEDGRAFAPTDTAGSPAVAILTRRLATRLFPKGALGQHIRIGLDPARADVEIVGVCGDPRLGDVRKPPTPAVFRPLNQEEALAKQPMVLVRAAGDPRLLEGPLREGLAALHREYTPQSLPLDVLIGNSELQERIMAIIATMLGSFVLALAFAGLLALLMHRVERRVPELSVRLALGASRASVRRLVSREAFRLVGLGLVVGVPAALLVARLTQAVLFEVAPSDVSALAATTAVMAAVAVLAVIVPARRASQVDPSHTLRAQ